MRRKSITMTDVARRAEVSISTVSRVVNGSVNVSEQLSRQVQSAIAELGYQPKRWPSAPADAANVAVIIPNINSPYFHNLLQGVQSVCFDNGCMLQIYSSGDDPEIELIHADALIARPDVKGVIFAGAWTWDHPEPILKLEAAGMPLCLINRHAAVARADILEVEREQGTYEAMAHLLRLGHRRIGCITAIPNAAVHPDDAVGYRRALREHGIPIEQDLIVKTWLSTEGGFRAGLELLARRERPTAILARTDRLAIGAMRSAWEAGVAIPNELSIIGYDDEPDARFTRPALTTMRQPQYDMGTRAANLLFERVANKALPPRQVIMQPQLILRETTAAARPA